MSEFNVGDKVYLECEVKEKDMSDSTYALIYKNWHGDNYSLSNFVTDDALHTPDELYNKGLNDAWELAKKIVLPGRDGGYSWQKFERIFDYRDYDSVLKAFTPQEALAKVKAYEERNEIRIRVGDVVELKGDHVVESIVTGITKTNIYRLFKDGSCGSSCYREDLIKTGKHFDSIDEFMKQED